MKNLVNETIRWQFIAETYMRCTHITSTMTEFNAGFSRIPFSLYTLIDLRSVLHVFYASNAWLRRRATGTGLCN